nr:hypothetical protein [Candidatus Brachybacter algidus]
MAGIQGRLISPELMIDVFFSDLNDKIKETEQTIETAIAGIAEIEEEQSDEDGLFADLEKINVGEVTKLLKAKEKESFAMAAEPQAVYGANTSKNEKEILENYIHFSETIKKANGEIKVLQAELEKAIIAKYPTLTETEIKNVVINYKWKATLRNTIQQEQDKISQGLTQRIQALAERYASTLTTLDAGLISAENKVKLHLQKMNLIW